jgi:ribosomal protein S18 acetylase RimI-like enzyme
MPLSICLVERPVGDSVLELVAEIERLSFAQTPAESISSLHELRRIVISNRSLLLLAKVETNQGLLVTGFLLLQWSSICGSISKLAVHPDFRRQGVGHALFGYALEHLKTKIKGIQRCTLHVDTMNTGAISLYSSKFGFSKEVEIEFYYGQGRNALRMALDWSNDS